MSAYAISTNFLNTETDIEGQNATPLLHDWHLAQPNHPPYADVMSSRLIYRAQPILAPRSKSGATMVEVLRVQQLGQSESGIGEVPDLLAF
ncbi:hypothetical protein N7530_007676 [Penicillium desertorum]|uniref:Uncharacterized protein n=1 Tax=Penicillium desertorum TaxID=1303715 RepID=A0A9X0BK97_9EURO|nr:hypothetical protein N7530_007676 [Penicillium desertorum]